MGIQVEFNPDLALRDIAEYLGGRRSLEECIPTDLQEGRVYPFLKSGQRNYWLLGEIPLCSTNGRGNLSRPLAAILITEVTHTVKDGEVYTSGNYLVKKVFDEKDETIHFEGFQYRRP